MIPGNCDGVDIDVGVKVAFGLSIGLDIKHSPNLQLYLIWRPRMDDFNPVDILKEIADKGNCDSFSFKACLSCPLAKLKMRTDGSGWLSCFDATGAANEKNEEQITLRYKEYANKILADLTLDGVIKNGSSS